MKGLFLFIFMIIMTLNPAHIHGQKSEDRTTDSSLGKIEYEIKTSRWSDSITIILN